jgi:Forkhead domain/FHA domain
MSSQVLAAPLVGPDLSRHAAAQSSTPAEDLDSPQAHNTVFDQTHSDPEQSNPSPSLLSRDRNDAPDAHIAHQHNQATFEQTQRAVGNLLDALRTNDEQSHMERDATERPSSGALEKIACKAELRGPSVSPLGPQSPHMPAPVSTGFTFPNAQALVDNSLAILPAGDLTVSMANVSKPPSDLTLGTFNQPQNPQYTNLPDETVAETVEEELPLNVQNAQDTGQISAFAKLEFDDGPFYITTYSLELGRDARAYRSAKARLVAQQAQQKGEGSSSATSHPSSGSKREGGSQVKGSVVSDRGGFYGVDDIEGEAQEADEEQQRQRVNPSQSSNRSASSIVNPKDLYTQPPLPHFNYQAYPIEEYEREAEDVAAPVTSKLVLEQEEGFLLPIHHAPVKDDLEQDVANHRSVSRRHAKIFWEDDCFRFHVKGVNGAFVNEVHYPMGAIVPLRSDVSIQIKGIKFQFKLPVHNSIESSEESDQVEDDSANQNPDSSSATSGLERTVSPGTNGRTPLKVKIRNFRKASPPPHQQILGPDGKPKRRGPGRPPKDGIMSKRERTAKERADREAAAKAANGGVTPEPSARGRSGRLTAKSATETEDPKPAKRKYTKRKSTHQDGNDLTPKLEEDSEAAVDGAPPTKKARATRSESPEYPKLEDLDEKELERPPYNYSILIYDLLKDSPKPLDLKGIYRGLKMKWPHFLYRYKDAKGWESSVRHNVNEDKLKIIEKVDRVGKGYSYRAKPGVDIEQHKKKRARSPPAAQKISAPPQQRYQQQAHPPPASYSYPQGQPNPPSHHGMYGHLIPTTVPHGSMSYTMSYPPTTAVSYSSGGMPSATQFPTSGPPLQKMPYSEGTGPSSTTITASAAAYPPSSASHAPRPTPGQARPAPYNDQQQGPSRPPSSPHYAPSHQKQPPPPPPVSYQKQPQTQQPLPPPPHLGVSPFDPFLPAGLSVISTFESSLLDGVENPADVPRIKATLASVRNRVFEGATASSLPDGETQDERTFLHYFRHILENERFRNPVFVGWKAVSAERERVRRSEEEKVEKGNGQAADGMQRQHARSRSAERAVHAPQKQQSHVDHVIGEQETPSSKTMGLRWDSGGLKEEDIGNDQAADEAGARGTAKDEAIAATAAEAQGSADQLGEEEKRDDEANNDEEEKRSELVGK